MNSQSRSLVRSALLASVAGAVLPFGIASASVTLYTSDTDFTTDASAAGLTQTYMESFEENTIPGGYAFLTPPLSYGVPNEGFPTGLDAPDLSVAPAYGGLFALMPYEAWPNITSAVVGTNSEDDTTVLDFANGGVNAVGFEVWGIDTFTTNYPDVVDYVVYDTSGVEIQSGVFPTPTSESGSFMGVVSTEPIGSITLSGKRFGLATQEYLDNIQGWHAPAGTPGDVNGDDVVNFADILQVIGAWGPCSGCAEDLDGSGDVGFSDILVVIGNWS